MKRNHQCPFQNCKCDYCSLTFKRREIMKHQQRVRRSRITSQVESDGAPSAGEEPEEEEGDFTYYQEEGRRTSLSSANTSDASFRYAENAFYRGQHSTAGEMKLNDAEVNNLSIASTSVSLRSTPDTEAENSNPYHTFSSSRDSFHPQGIEDLSVRESPPPLIHMISDKTRANSSFIKETESISPPLVGIQNPFLSTVARRGDGSGASSPMIDKTTFPALSFESLKEEPKDDLNNSPVTMFHREHSSFRSFPFSSQPLERLTALNASLDPALKFTNSLEELRIRNYSFLPTTLIDSSLRNTSRPTSSLLAPQYYQQQHHHQLRESNQVTSQPIRPLPLNYSQMRHQGNFGPNLWNHMFLPFNFGLHQNATETSLMRFQGIVASSRFSPFNSQYN
ncbi:hypothetical protein Avbf_15209 [Armadillidium vulgare]|nr:hypothetical protein Avbf_15209 [Armadillidium vulgare]